MCEEGLKLRNCNLIKKFKRFSNERRQIASIADGKQQQQQQTGETDDSQTGSIRSKRAKKRSSSVVTVGPEPSQRLDVERPDVPIIPPGFLSPSVQEYLELGKSIPGKFLFDFLVTIPKRT